MVATAAAITVLAKIVYRPWWLDGGRVEFRQLEDKLPTLDIGLVWPRHMTFSDTAQSSFDSVSKSGRV